MLVGDFALVSSDGGARVGQDFARNKLKRKIVSLTLTEYCNLDCVYCYEKQKSKKSMDINIAKRAIIAAFKDCRGFDEVEFDLFGGEPVVRKSMIMNLVEWLRAQSVPLPYCFFLQTNGTLVHGDFQEWLLKNRDIVNVGISLDGMPETHNRNRTNSYALIDMEFFVKNYAKQGVRMTVAPQGVKTLADDIRHIHRLGFERVDAFFAFGVDWGDESARDLQQDVEYQLYDLANFYLRNPELKECSLFDMELTRLLKKNERSQKWCGAGESMLSISVDGNIAPCHMFQSNSNTRAPDNQTVARLLRKEITDESCAACEIESLCPNCYGMNYLRSGDIAKREKSLCYVTKIRTLAVSYLRARQIELGLFKGGERKVIDTIRAIKIVQSGVLTNPT